MESMKTSNSMKQCFKHQKKKKTEPRLTSKHLLSFLVCGSNFTNLKQKIKFYHRSDIEKRKEKRSKKERKIVKKIEKKA